MSTPLPTEKLQPGELELWNSFPHWAVLLWPTIIAFLFALPGLLLFAGALVPDGSLGGTLLLALGGFLLTGTGIVFFTAAFIRRKSTKLVLTNRRILISEGILEAKTIEIGIGEVKTVEYSQSRLARTLGCATVKIQCSSGAVQLLQKVCSPAHFCQCLQALRMHRQQQPCKT